MASLIDIKIASLVDIKIASLIDIKIASESNCLQAEKLELDYVNIVLLYYNCIGKV